MAGAKANGSLRFPLSVTFSATITLHRCTVLDNCLFFCLTFFNTANKRERPLTCPVVEYLVAQQIPVLPVCLRRPPAEPDLGGGDGLRPQLSRGARGDGLANVHGDGAGKGDGGFKTSC